MNKGNKAGLDRQKRTDRKERRDRERAGFRSI